MEGANVGSSGEDAGLSSEDESAASNEGEGSPGEGERSSDERGFSSDEELSDEDGEPTGTPTLENYTDTEQSGRENTVDWDEDDLIIDKLNGHIRDAQESRQWGSVTGKLRERVIASLTPHLNYQAVLRQFHTSILSQRRVLTRMKPSRRYGFLYMGSRRDFTTNLLFAVDVSGSMSNDELARGFAVLNRFFKYGIETIDVIQFDTEIKGAPTILKRARREIDVFGRGGTNFDPVIEYIDKFRHYDGLIIFTDGYAPVPPVPKNRKTRVLWLFISKTTHENMAENVRHIGRSTFLQQ